MIKYKSTVIIPVYNTEQYLEECIQSVLGQTQKEVEIILVDDGSTDHSYEIMLSYEKQYSNVRVLHQENKKLGAARNLGVKYANGQYIFFLDSDDYIKENCLEELYKCAEKNRLDFVTYDSDILIEDIVMKGGYETYDRSMLGIREDKVYQGLEFLNTYFLSGGAFVSACLSYYNREFLQKNQICFEEQVYYEDNEYALKVCCYAQRMMYLPGKFYVRRYRENSIMTSECGIVHLQSSLKMNEKCLQVFMQMPDTVENSEGVRGVIATLADRLIYQLQNDKNKADLQNNPYLYEFCHFFLECDKGVFLSRLGMELAFDYYYVLSMMIEKGYLDNFSDVLEELRKITEILKLRVRKTTDALLAGMGISSEKEEKVIIYGTGKVAERIITCYRSIYGEALNLEDKAVFANTQVKLGETFLEHYPVLDIESIERFPISVIIVASTRYELEMCGRLDKLFGKKYAYITYREMANHTIEEMIKVSVIVPIYNASAYLTKCVESILSQTLREMELICIDDGSTDNSLSLLREIQERDVRVHIFTQPNSGAGCARNYGLRKAIGEYVAFVDADDFLMDSGALACMYQAACKSGMAIVGAFRNMEQGGIISAAGLHRRFLQGHPEGGKIAYCDYQYEYHFQNYIYKRDMLLENQIFFPDYRRFQDPPFFVRAMIAAKEFYVVPKEYYCYHCEHENYRFSEKMVMDIVRGLTELLELSASANLRKLHVSTVDRLDGSFFWDILECAKRSVAFLELLWYANGLIHWDWISERYGILQTKLKVLEVLRQHTSDICKDYEDMIDRKHRYGYPLPFYRMRQGNRIVLYAAGHVGRAYYEQLRERSDYHLSLWADVNYQAMPQVLGVTIASPEQISETEYDYILVAVEERMVAEQISQKLVQMGAMREKIIWGYFAADLSEDFSIFGAGRAASSVAEAIYGLWGRKPHCFVVSNPAEAPEELYGCPVISLEQYGQSQDEILLLAVPETQIVEDACRERNLSYQCVSGGVENKLLGELYKKEGRFCVFAAEDEDTQEVENVQCRIYMAESRYDKKLKDEYRFSAYICPIFVGAASLTAQEMRSISGMLRDDTGDNISLQNSYYCELTALYWIWKNAKEDYVGLCHYRRVFDLSDRQLEALLSKQPDAVLLYPSVQYPNAGRHERRYLNDEVRQALRDALKMQSPEVYKEYEKVMGDKYIYNFNMIIAKKKVLDSYCEWLFYTIWQIEDICRKRGIIVEKRQQGYWAENLQSFYFLTNKQGLFLYHVGHRLLI